MIRSFLVLTALLLALVALEACVTDSDRPALFVGMSRDRLKARFGEPLRIERTPTGGEDWYYSFSSPLDVQVDGYHDEPSRSTMASVTISESTGTHECPIHISSDGFVIEPLPSGHIAK